MTTEQIITLAKERLGRDITEQEAQNYIDGKTALPDEALDIVSGGGDCLTIKCPLCHSTNLVDDPTNSIYKFLCQDCGYTFLKVVDF